MDKNKIILELFHYVILVAVLLLGWIWLMAFWKEDLAYTILSWGVLLVAIDQFLHKYLFDEDYLWED